MADIVNPGQTSLGPLNSGALPKNTDLVIYRGDYLRLVITLKDASNVPIDLTGCTPKASLKSDYADRDSRDFDCTLGANTGEVIMFMSSSITKDLLPGSYIYDFQVTFSDGETRTYLTGDVTVYNEVTT